MRFLLFLFLLLLVSCSYYSKNTTGSNFQRIVVFGEAPLELILKLGFRSKIVGIAYLDNPDSITNKLKLPVVSPGWANKESIIALRPDLIITSEAALKEDRSGSVAFWKKRGIQVCVIDDYRTDKSFESYYNDLQFVGNLLHCRHQTDSITDRLKESSLRYKYLNYKQIKRILHLSYNSQTGHCYYSPPKLCLIDEIVENCGGEYINLGEKYFYISNETILKANPDKIIITRYRRQKEINVIQQLSNESILKYVKAIKNQQLIEVDYTKAIRGTTDMEDIYLMVSKFVNQ